MLHFRERIRELLETLEYMYRIYKGHQNKTNETNHEVPHQHDAITVEGQHARHDKSTINQHAAIIGENLKTLFGTILILEQFYIWTSIICISIRRGSSLLERILHLNL